MNKNWQEKGKPLERVGRQATDLIPFGGDKVAGLTGGIVRIVNPIAQGTGDTNYNSTSVGCVPRGAGCNR